VPSYNIPAIEALTNALQDATRSEREGKEFGCAEGAKSSKRSDSLHSKPVEKAVERFINENRAHDKKARNVIVGSY
jgi:hypothetical protein